MNTPHSYYCIPCPENVCLDSWIMIFRDPEAELSENRGSHGNISPKNIVLFLIIILSLATSESLILKAQLHKSQPEKICVFHVFLPIDKRKKINISLSGTSACKSPIYNHLSASASASAYSSPSLRWATTHTHTVAYRSCKQLL